jgi:RHS repeat-associated protein
MRRNRSARYFRRLPLAVVSAASVLVFVSLLSGAAAAPPSTAITYAYDELGRLVAVSDPANGTAKYAYDAVGNLSSITRQTPSVVSIASFAPKAGPAGTTVAIYGTGFSATPSQNTVKFNGTVAPIVSARATQLVATVPSNATSGTITVTAPGGSATSASAFTVGTGGPAITGFTPAVATLAGSVTINGSSFDTTVSNDVVATSKARAQVTAASATSLTGTIAGAGSGHITVATPAGTAVSSGVLFVPPAPYAATDVDSTAQMAIGDTRTLTVGSANKIALAAFDASSGQRVSLNFSSITIPGSSCCAAKVSLLNPDGSTLVSPTYIGTANTFVDAATLTQDGTYTIVLDPESTGTGSATFTLYNVPANGAGSISPGGAPVTVTTTIPGQNASLTFSGTSGQRVSLNIDQVSIGSSSCCSGKVSISNPDGSTLVLPTFFGTLGNTFVDTAALTQSGTYTVLVDPQGPATGSARLSLYDVPADASGTITPGGASVTASVTTPGQNARYTFSGSSGQRVSLNLDQVSIGSSSCCSGKVSITNPDGSTLVAPTFFGTLGNTFVDTVSLGQTGTYTIFVDPQSNATGSARLSLYDVPADASGTISIGGPPVTVSATVPGQNGSLSFAGTAGKHISLLLSNVTLGSSACCSGKVSLKNPDGSTLINPSFFGTAGATVTATLPVDGSYLIVIDPQSNATGSADLTLSDPPSAPNAVFSAALFEPLASIAHPSAHIASARKTSAAVERRAPRTSSPTPRISFSPPASEVWQPGRQQLRGDWRRALPDSPWRSLAPLQAEAGTAALSGQTLRLDGRPLRNVTLHLEDTQVSAMSDASGRFLLTDAPAGHQILIVDGASAGKRGKAYGLFEIGVDLAEGKTTALDYTIWMPRLDTAHERMIPSPTTEETVVTTPRIPGLELRLQAGTVIRDDEGNPVTHVSITAVPVDRPPFPLPLGISVPLYFTIQPGGVYLSKPARLIYPNYTHLPPGQRVAFWNYDPDQKGWYVYGQGIVDPSARQVIPDEKTRIWEFTGAMISGGPNPPNKGPKDKKRDGDPVDLGTGLLVSEKTDLVEPGPMPIALTRTYRQGDGNSYEFGIGQTMPYDLRLWSVNNYQDADLVLPDGGRIHYIRISPGTGFSDAVYEAQTTPTAFLKSRISWNGSGWNLTLKDGTIYVFGDLAPLQSIRDRFGNTLSLTRTSGQSGNISQITSSSGRWIKFSYDGSNRVTQAQDNSGRTVAYSYYPSGELNTVTDAKGGVTTYTYDAAHQLKTIRDPRNITYLTVDYDANGRVQRQTQADSSTYQFAYVDDGNGNVTQATVTDPNGNQRRVNFNSAGYSTSEIEALGKPEQQTTTFERQAGTNLMTAVVDPLNRRTEYGYDTVGNLTSVTRLAGTGSAVTTSYTYDPSFSQLKTRTDPLNHTTSYGYNAQGALTSVTDPLNHTTTLAVNGAGQPTTITDALNHQTTLSYLLGDLVSLTDPLGSVTRQFVDNAGRLGSVTNPLGNRVTYQYDGLNELTKIIDPKNGQSSLAYDGNGNVTSFTDALNHATTYTYTSLDRLATRKDALLRQETYSYDANGNLALFTDRKGQKTRFKYDALNRRILTGYGASGTPPNETYSSSVAYTYDGGDRLRSAVDSANGTITDDYDGLDRPSQETTTQGTVSYTYDSASRRQNMTVAGQPQVSYGYDAADRLISVTQASSNVAMSYDDANRSTSVTLPDGIAQQYGYDNSNRLTGISYKLGASTLGDLNYDYDVAGQRNAVWGSYARTTLPTAQSSYTYDAANELTKIGNSRTTNDANGSLTNDTVTSYTWNNRGQLSASSKTGLAGSYAYDAFGRRRSETIGAQTTGFLYDGRNVVQELSGSTPTANLLVGLGLDQTYSRTDASGAKSFLGDALGSTVALADNTGTVSTSYTYGPFGSATSSGVSSSNSFQYTGRENDTTGLNFLRARYYSPGLQRFLAEDPIGLGGGDANLYGYVSNRPLGLIDPLGLCGSGLGGFISSLIGRCGSWNPFDPIRQWYHDHQRIISCTLFATSVFTWPVAVAGRSYEAYEAARAGKSIYEYAMGGSGIVRGYEVTAVTTTIGHVITGGCLW